MINLSKEVSNLSNIVSKSIKEESSKLGKSISENNVLTSAKLNKEFEKLMNENKKTQNTKLLKELSNSTSSLNAALEAISSQNKLLVKEIKGQKENITFP
jgi:methyl-accepting chemotaxis protein